jgi:hypothetical protein
VLVVGLRNRMEFGYREKKPIVEWVCGGERKAKKKKERREGRGIRKIHISSSPWTWPMVE